MNMKFALLMIVSAMVLSASAGDWAGSVTFRIIPPTGITGTDSLRNLPYDVNVPGFILEYAIFDSAASGADGAWKSSTTAEKLMPGNLPAGVSVRGLSVRGNSAGRDTARVTLTGRPYEALELIDLQLPSVDSIVTSTTINTGDQVPWGTTLNQKIGAQRGELRIESAAFRKTYDARSDLTVPATSQFDRYLGEGRTLSIGDEGNTVILSGVSDRAGDTWVGSDLGFDLTLLKIRFDAATAGARTVSSYEYDGYDEGRVEIGDHFYINLQPENTIDYTGTRINPAPLEWLEVEHSKIYDGTATATFDLSDAVYEWGNNGTGQDVGAVSHDTLEIVGSTGHKIVVKGFVGAADAFTAATNPSTFVVSDLTGLYKVGSDAVDPDQGTKNADTVGSKQITGFRGTISGSVGSNYRLDTLTYVGFPGSTADSATIPTIATTGIQKKVVSITGLSYRRPYNRTNKLAATDISSNANGVTYRVSGAGTNVSLVLITGTNPAADTTAITLDGFTTADAARATANLITLGGFNGEFTSVEAGTREVRKLGGTLGGALAHEYELDTASVSRTLNLSGEGSGITRVWVQVAGLSSANQTRTYDGTRTLVLSATSKAVPAANVILAGDELNVNVIGTPIATYARKDVIAAPFTTNPILVSGLALDGSASANYRIDTAITVASAPQISKKAVRVLGVTVANVKEGTTAATITGFGYLVDTIPGDNIRVDVTNATATVAGGVKAGQANVKPTLAGFVLAGPDSSNYSLSMANVEAPVVRIIPANPVTDIRLSASANAISAPNGQINIFAVTTPRGAVGKAKVKWYITDSEGRTTTIADSLKSGFPRVAADSLAPDTLVLRARNLGNGTVRIIAEALDSSGYQSSPFSVVVTGQRSAPQSLAVLPGISISGSNAEQGQAILTWLVPQSGSSGITGYGVSIGGDYTTTGEASTLTRTILGLERGKRVTFLVRANYDDGTSGPPARVEALVPDTRTEIGIGQISYSVPGAGLTYNRANQKIGRATLVANTWSASGADPFDTLYRYDSADVTDGVLYTAAVTSFSKDADILGKRSAGNYKATVLFRNSRFEGRRVVEFTIRPKTLTQAMLTLNSPVPTYTYDKTAAEPDYKVVDEVELILNTDFVAGSEAGLLSNKSDVYVNNINAGTNTASVSVRGIGNYTGAAVSRTFTINKKAITLDTLNSGVKNKEYDGTADALDSSLVVKFLGAVDQVDEAALVLGTGYTVTNARYTGATVATANNMVTATIQLVATGDVSKNYALATSPSFRKLGVIDPRKPDSSDFTYSIPKDHLNNGTGRGISFTGFKAPKADPTCTLTVLYGDPGDTAKPVLPGTYLVKVDVKTSANSATPSNFEAGVVTLGSYVIGDPVKPVITGSTNLTALSIRSGNPLTLSVTATSPNDGALSYQWYRNDTLITGARGASYAPSTAVVGSTSQYFVHVTNVKAGIHVPDSVKSDVATITVLEPAKSLIGADVKISGESYTYTGGAIQPEGVTVTLAGTTLNESSDYVVVVTQNVNAGRALVTVRGLDAYKDSSSGTFVIARKKLEDSDLTLENWAPEYNGSAQAAKVIPTAGRTGLGSVSIRYWTDSTTSATTAPVNAGDYDLTVTIAQGLNFTAGDTVINLGTYSIRPKEVTKADFNFTPLPASHKYTGAPQGIGAVTLKKSEEDVEISVQYNGSEDLPVAVGAYDVTVRLSGSNKNFIPTVALLGVYEIVDEDVSVASNDRVIPGSGSEVVVVAPVQVIAGEFTVGPNPVAKASGKVGFFWQGKAVKSGTLYVFDASGNLVTKVAVADKAGTTARREIGSWNLTAKGAPVAEGTYLVKGALVGKDGGNVKVSSILSVAR